MNITNQLKSILTISCLILICSSVKAQRSFVIDGQLASDINAKIKLSYKNNGVSIEDSTMVSQGKFQFKGNIGDPTFAKLTLNPPVMITVQNFSTLDFQDFFIDGGSMQVKSDKGLKVANIAGGATQNDFKRRGELYKPIQLKMDSLNKIVEKHKEGGDVTKMEKARTEMYAEMSKTAGIDSNFIKENPGSYLSMDIWRSKHRGTLRLFLEPEFLHFKPEIRKTFAGREIQARFDLAKHIAPGQMAPDFKLPDTLGKELTLSSFRGKNVFVCFYMPDFMNYETFAFNLGRINRVLKDKNFVMLTVYYSYSDKSAAYWKETIEKSKFNWINLNDVNGITDRGAISPVARAYGLSYNTMPAGFLIGTDGKILASQVRLSDTGLAQELEKLIK